MDAVFAIIVRYDEYRDSPTLIGPLTEDDMKNPEFSFWQDEIAPADYGDRWFLMKPIPLQKMITDRLKEMDEYTAAEFLPTERMKALWREVH